MHSHSIPGEWFLSCQHLIYKKTFRTYLPSFVLNDPSWIVKQHAARVPGLLSSLGSAAAFWWSEGCWRNARKHAVPGALAYVMGWLGCLHPQWGLPRDMKQGWLPNCSSPKRSLGWVRISRWASGFDRAKWFPFFLSQSPKVLTSND